MANFRRGVLTNEIATKFNITLVELRLLPYLQYLILNNKPVDPLKISPKERTILQKWRDKGSITFSMTDSCSCTKEFWDWMNEILWHSYVPKINQ